MNISTNPVVDYKIKIDVAFAASIFLCHLLKFAGVVRGGVIPFEIL